MMEKYRDADAIVTIEGKEYALYKKGPLKKYPYMIDIATGGIPHREQRPLLKTYLLLNGINVELWDERGPHWFVRQAVKVAQGKIEKAPVQSAVFRPHVPALPEDSSAMGKNYLPIPSMAQVEHYLAQWDGLEDYSFQEEALDKLFFRLCPENTCIEDILLKVSTLNDFYSTHIYSTYPVAKHILALDIDERLQTGDLSLVKAIQKVTVKGTERNLYSFASKYCSHHNPLAFPIYDSYVDKILYQFMKQDHFASFRRGDLKDYQKFYDILLAFRSFYGLEKYNLKEIDKYLWQLGKDLLPKNYGKRTTD